MDSIEIVSHRTEKELPKEVRDFFRDLLAEHRKGIPNNMLIEAININVNLHLQGAVIESQTSSYDMSKSYLDQFTD